MSYFPIYLNMDLKKILIVGGGNIAYEKLSHILDFTKNITLISQEYNEKCINIIKKYNLSYQKRGYKKGDIEGFDIVIVAVDSIDLQKEIYFETRGKNIMCNVVDVKKYCDFIFPSYIKQGDLVISVSTSGSSPAVAKYLRRYIENLIPTDIAEFLKKMKKIRAELPKGKERMKLLDNEAKKYFSDS